MDGDQLALVIDQAGYTPKPPNGGTDDYRCFLIDPGLNEDRYLTGVTFLPSNEDVVHHAILFKVPADLTDEAQSADDSAAGPGWTCFGDAGIPSHDRGIDALNDAAWLAAWAPGGEPDTMPEGTGVLLERGSKIVLQVHYNTLFGSGLDKTAVELTTEPRSADLAELKTMLIPAPVELPCTNEESGPLCDRKKAVARTITLYGPELGRTIDGLQLLCGGDPAHPKPGNTQSCTRTVKRPMTIRAAAGHMHLLGASTAITANVDGSDTTVIDLPKWDFNDQRARSVTPPIVLAAGDTITVTCTHDAALRSQLKALRDTPPKYVTWGEGSTDEMCLGILLYTDE